MVRSPHDFPPDFLWPPAPARGPRCRVMGYVPSAMAAPSAGSLCRDLVSGRWRKTQGSLGGNFQTDREPGQLAPSARTRTHGREPWNHGPGLAQRRGVGHTGRLPEPGQGPGACPFSEARTPHVISELRLWQNRGPAAVAGQAVVGILTSVTFTTPICGLNRSILKVCSQ